MRESELFYNQIKHVKKLNIGEFEPPKFSEPQIEKSEVNNLSWKEFKEEIRPLAVINVPGIDAEYLITPKNVPWALQDVNVYIGAANKDYFELSDLNENEGRTFFDVNGSIAKGLLADQNFSETHISIGFNPDDFSPGHHSVKRLHSHIYVADNPELQGQIKKREWAGMNKNEKFTFIEPFSQVFYEYLEYLLKTGIVEEGFIQGEIENNPGYLSFYVEKDIDPMELFNLIKKIYLELKKEYDNFLEIFTDRSLDPETERYIPRPVEERLVLLESHLNNRPGVFSQESKKILSGLAQNLVSALPKKDGGTMVDSNETLWISKGFSGAFTQSFKLNEDLSRIDYFPRVVTTNTVEKTIFGKDHPTVIKRDIKNATENDFKLMDQYHQAVVKLADQFQTTLESI